MPNFIAVNLSGIITVKSHSSVDTSALVVVMRNGGVMLGFVVDQSAVVTTSLVSHINMHRVIPGVV